MMKRGVYRLPSNKLYYSVFIFVVSVPRKKNLTQAFVFKASDTNPNLIVVSFRGTELFSSDDWCTDLDISWYELKNVGKVHAGFSRALGLQQNGWPKENISLIHQYAYYTIRQKLRDMLARDKNLKNLAFVFYEICHLHEINVREDAPNANYISMLWLIPKLLSGVWEFIRSFIIRFWKGNEYKENWTMRTVRIVGIIIPGVSDHFPLDYVNSTRLGGLARPVATTTPQDKLYLIA
ncbi:hypothetical protein F2Q69_00046126 [Brassica cretica]|uniref:Fungal lipase-type domain-containing protein n=1 Tax=Brassica cretica TaxID=69181 RepID=A0A8S9PZ63_BRACR|nr:hypothetical protein F2Q69_00046126 [Brassica cretica]